MQRLISAIVNNNSLILYLMKLFISLFRDFRKHLRIFGFWSGICVHVEPNQEYGEFINSTDLTSTIICQPLLEDELHCYLNDIMVITSKYTNFNDRITTSNLIEVGHWFHMKFTDRGVMSVNTKLGAGEINNYLITDVVS